MIRVNLSTAPKMVYRTVDIAWMPRSPFQWATFTAARLAAGALWNAMVVRHARIRRLRWTKWPSLARWQAWAKGKFHGLSAQSIQRTVGEFCDALNSTTKARKAQRAASEEVTAEYPWRQPKYRDVVFPNQSAAVRGGFLRLGFGGGHGCKTRFLRVKLPIALPGRLMEVRLAHGVVQCVCEVPGEAPDTSSVTIGVDLGINTILAATDGVTAVLVSGRELKATQQWRNKRLASAFSALSRTKQGSRRQKRLQQAKRRMLDRAARKVRDFTHKATRAIARAFPGARVIVGKPFNHAADKLAPKQAQQVHQAANARLIAQLNYKLAGATKVSEAYSSQTCPVCGCRQRCRRVYRCGTCGFTAPRDVVVSTNIRSIGLFGEMRLHQPVATVVRYVRPLRKYPVPSGAGSPGGTPASRPPTRAQCAPTSAGSPA